MDILTADDLLRRQEQPLRKKRRLSQSSDSENDTGSETFSASGSDDSPPHNFHIDSSLEDHSRFSERTISRSPKFQESLPAQSYTFSSLGISAPLQATLKSMSIKFPTEVQAACIPPLLEGKRISMLKASLRTHASAKVETALGMRKRAQEKRWRLLCLSSRNSLWIHMEFLRLC